jgi:hypothetical protein
MDIFSTDIIEKLKELAEYNHVHKAIFRTTAGTKRHVVELKVDDLATKGLLFLTELASDSSITVTMTSDYTATGLTGGSYFGPDTDIEPFIQISICQEVSDNLEAL